MTRRYQTIIVAFLFGLSINPTHADEEQTFCQIEGEHAEFRAMAWNPGSREAQIIDLKDVKHSGVLVAHHYAGEDAEKTNFVFEFESVPPFGSEIGEFMIFPFPGPSSNYRMVGAGYSYVDEVRYLNGIFPSVTLDCTTF